MRHKLLGIICILYSIMIGVLFYFKMMNNFLIPKMQLYLFIAICFLFIVGICLLFSSKKEKINYSDLLLILPLIIVFLIGDGKFNIKFASTRSSSLNQTVSNKNKTVEKEVVSNDNSSIEIEVEDISYAGLSDRITYNRNPERIVGKTIRVRGFILKESLFIPKKYFAIGKYLISCCAADAGFIGFFVEGDSSSIKENGWYEIDGVLKLGKDTYNNTVVIIDMVNYKKIPQEKEQYVYPCYSYGDGSCSEVLKYNLN